MHNTELKELRHQIQNVSKHNFDAIAKRIFSYQYNNNPIYQQFCQLLHKKEDTVDTLQDIPFLPISFFKNFKIKTGTWKDAKLFTSSGTTGDVTSRHYVRDENAYTYSTIRGFESFYGSLKRYCVLALLPAYLEREGSSLVYMADAFIKKSEYKDSGFFLYDYKKVKTILNKNREKGIPTLLLGVSFALWDMAEQMELAQDPNLIVMETGGMKGRRREIVRAELHHILTRGFGVPTIHSEYGMTELLSQAYSKGAGIFETMATMKIMVREINDPLAYLPYGKTGAFNIIDLNNVDSCSFIATDDLGKTFENNTFEILGRMDYSDRRGCNLLIAE